MKLANHETVEDGCEFCGDFPVRLHSKCHPTAPLRIEMDKENILTAYCYIPECNKKVFRAKMDLKADL